MVIRLILRGIAVALLSAGVSRAQPEIAEGRPFPAIELPTLTGESMSIRDFQGERVILHLFASW